MPDPFISVIVPTYQHVKFIERCLLSILEQHCSYSMEILVGEDDSSDGTSAICERIAQEHPDRIKLFLRKGMPKISISGQKTGRANVIDLYKAAKGKYIAACEGDDYWIDPNKLQRQVDALEADPRAIGCFTDAYNETDGKRVPYMDHGYATSPKAPVGQKEIAIGQGIPTCTLVFRNMNLDRIYEALKTAPVGDTLLTNYLSGFGHFIYQPQRTGVRVVHAGGVYSMRSSMHKLDVQLRAIPYLDDLSDHNFSEYLERRKRILLNQAWSEAITTNNRDLAKYVWPQIAKERSNYGWNITTTIRNFFKAYWPLPDKVYGSLTGK